MRDYTKDRPLLEAIEREQAQGATLLSEVIAGQNVYVLLPVLTTHGGEYEYLEYAAHYATLQEAIAGDGVKVQLTLSGPQTAVVSASAVFTRDDAWCRGEPIVQVSYLVGGLLRGFVYTQRREYVRDYPLAQGERGDVERDTARVARDWQLQPEAFIERGAGEGVYHAPGCSRFSRVGAARQGARELVLAQGRDAHVVRVSDYYVVAGDAEIARYLGDMRALEIVYTASAPPKEPLARVFDAVWSDGVMRALALENVRHELSRESSLDDVIDVLRQVIADGTWLPIEDLDLAEVELAPLASFLMAYVGAVPLDPDYLAQN
jgi:hypothetical protein